MKKPPLEDTAYGISTLTGVEQRVRSTKLYSVGVPIVIEGIVPRRSGYLAGINSMLIKPNRTRLRAEVIASRQLKDDSGSEIDVRVLENLSDSEQDFLKPEQDHSLTLYRRKPLPAVASGDIVEVEAEVRGGPFGQRIICRDLKKIADR